ncbi:GAF domain-containing protein [Halapricum sp. CBA1109]|uniref:bacterio-opsin activator domain-containing protein n=1 Tax=Halapricum sp. CBA1109 TaxID=2668068 RepID=UPI0012F8837A|nr:bacterio-opsin activator domain-containing protein [Halapricum sp. CBA1109]MUV89153.1 GAF domain-containing protein [Halapricum sp. CBA1109]
MTDNDTASMGAALSNAPIGVLRTTPDGTVTAVNDAATALFDTDTETLVGADIHAVFPRSASGTLRAVFDSTPPESASFEEYYPAVDRWLSVDVEPVEDGVVVYARDRSDYRDADQRTDRLERRLDRVESIDALVATVLRTLIDATDRAEVARTLCSGLAGEDGYAFAWVGERDRTDGRLRVVAADGAADAELREAIRSGVDAADPLPERRAIAAGSPTVVPRVADDDTLPRPVRVAAFGTGLQSGVAVPLVHRDSSYGVLGVYTAREDGLSEQERSSLVTLGSVAGFAVNAIRQEGLLFADTVTELTLGVSGSGTPLSGAAGADRTLSLSGVVPREDGSAVAYVRAEGDVDALPEVLSDAESTEAVRTIQASEAARTLEVELAPSTPLSAITSWGGTVEAATFEGEGGRITVVVPADSDPRRLVETVAETAASVEVRSKTDRARNPTTRQQFESELDARLTDRQRQVLRTAYLADYFSSPRGSSAEEVAEALGITGPTVLHHLRNAQRSLLDSFFEDGAQ